MKILIADDDPMFRAILSKAVKAWGDEPVVASGGQEAWQHLCAPDAPRLAILDWVMPDIDGLEVCRRIRQGTSPHYVYLILLTCRSEPASLLAGLEAGADDYLPKPIALEELRLRVQAGRRILEFLPGTDIATGEYRHLCRALLLARDVERKYIAHELHEGVAQTLSGVLMNLGRICSGIQEPTRKASLAAESMKMISECIRNIRVIAYQLHPPLLDDIGLPAALRAFAAESGWHDGVEIEVSIPAEFGRLHADLELALFRIAQEAVMQIGHHSTTHLAVIQIEREKDEITLNVRNHRDGPDGAARLLLPSALEIDANWSAMRERVEQNGGRFSVHRNSGIAFIATFPDARQQG